jgi:hypothetical protein
MKVNRYGWTYTDFKREADKVASSWPRQLVDDIE